MDPISRQVARSLGMVEYFEMIYSEAASEALEEYCRRKRSPCNPSYSFGTGPKVSNTVRVLRDLDRMMLEMMFIQRFNIFSENFSFNFPLIFNFSGFGSPPLTSAPCWPTCPRRRPTLRSITSWSRGPSATAPGSSFLRSSSAKSRFPMKDQWIGESRDLIPFTSRTCSYPIPS